MQFQINEKNTNCEYCGDCFYKQFYVVKDKDKYIICVRCLNEIEENISYEKWLFCDYKNDYTKVKEVN